MDHTLLAGLGALISKVPSRKLSSLKAKITITDTRERRGLRRGVTLEVNLPSKPSQIRGIRKKRAEFPTAISLPGHKNYPASLLLDLSVWQRLRDLIREGKTPPTQSGLLKIAGANIGVDIEFNPA